MCPTMNWSVWARIELVLTKQSIKPMLAVVPDNRDPKLMIEPARLDFWDCVCAWQAGGWSIALHGFEQLYNAVLWPAYSEFAGLPYDAQRAKLDQALAVFARHGVRADAWVAPAHTFDASTVKALLELGIDVISDGFYSPGQTVGSVVDTAADVAVQAHALWCVDGLLSPQVFLRTGSGSSSLISSLA